MTPSLSAAIASGDAASALREALREFDCQAGTVHYLGEDGQLHLAATHNIPPHIAEIVKLVPIGKGIAGLAAQKQEPVSICNLQTDTSGRARPAAKTTGMEGSLAVPMMFNGELKGVLGIAKASEHDWTPDETSRLMAVAAAFGAAKG